jgi:2'-5' RNA ligase
MLKRTIMIFPQLNQEEAIQRLRRAYDPLAELVAPHITLVFPFQSQLEREDLLDILQDSLAGERPFPLTLSGFDKKSDRYGHYLYFTVTQGEEELCRLHDKLYSGRLATLRPQDSYQPHMTLGKLPTAQELDGALEALTGMELCCSARIDKVSVELIGECGESYIEAEYCLK